MSVMLKLMFFGWGLLGMILHSVLAVDKPTIEQIAQFYRENSKGLLVSFLSYVCIYGIWAGMGQWAAALGWTALDKYSDPWLGAFAVVIGYAGDSLWPKLVNKVVKKSGLDSPNGV